MTENNIKAVLKIENIGWCILAFFRSTFTDSDQSNDFSADNSQGKEQGQEKQISVTLQCPASCFQESTQGT